MGFNVNEKETQEKTKKKKTPPPEKRGNVIFSTTTTNHHSFPVDLKLFSLLSLSLFFLEFFFLTQSAYKLNLSHVYPMHDE